MEWFTVKYRQSDGAVTETEFEVPDRVALFNMLKSKNILAISVRAGRMTNTRTTTVKTALVVGVLVSVVFLGVVVGLVAMSRSKKDVVSQTRISDNSNVDKPKLPRAISPRNQYGNVATEEVVQNPKVDPELAAIREQVKQMNREQREALGIEILKRQEIDFTPTTNHPFKTGTEWNMARIFSTRLGDPPPPLMPTPIRDELQLENILAASNPPLDGDSDRILDAKEMVKLAKDELKNYLKEGGSVDSFLQFYHSKLVDAYNTRREYAKEIVRMAIEEPEIAREFFERANEDLEKKGIRHVELSTKVKKRLGLED